MRDLKEAAQDVLLGTHFGDAIGVPFEMMTRPDILEATGGAGVTGPHYAIDPSKRKIPDTRGLAPGSTSDDSQLANAVADGLIMAGAHHLELQALLHLRALWHDVAGWGGTTKRSLYEIDKWYRTRRGKILTRPHRFRNQKDERAWEQAEPRHPSHPARWRPESRGNGPSMKIAPYGIRYGLLKRAPLEDGSALTEVLALSRLTHADPTCAIAAYAIAGVIADQIDASVEEAKRNLLPRVRAAETTLRLLHRGADRFSAALENALSLADVSRNPEALWGWGSRGRSDSLTSVPLAIAIWWRHAGGPPAAAVLEAVNAGGDTDTVAAMAGSMAGADRRASATWPSAWFAPIGQGGALKDGGALARLLGAQLHDVTLGVSEPHGWDEHALKRGLGYP